MTFRMICFCINELAHGKECLDVVTITSTTSDRVASFLNPTFKFHIIEDFSGLTWEMPELTFVKIMCGGSWFPSSRLFEEVGFQMCGKR